MNSESDNDVERDAKLTALYRAVSHDEPPAALDDAIRAAARREVGARPTISRMASRRSWHVPVSIAAVMVLSVTIVTLMKEEAPELTEAPRAQIENRTAEGYAVPGADNAVPMGKLKQGPREESAKNIGLKPSQSAASSSAVPPSSEVGTRTLAEKDMLPKDAGRIDSEAEPALAKRRNANSNSIDELRDAKVRGAREPPSQPANAEAQQEVAQTRQTPQARTESPKPATVAEPQASSATPPVAARYNEYKAQNAAPRERTDQAEAEPPARAQAFPVAPAPKPAPTAASPAKAAPMVTAPMAQAKKEASEAMRESSVAGFVKNVERDMDLPPEKWLERIEELRKQGKLDEAKASLMEFRRRYPDYRLPQSLRELSSP